MTAVANPYEALYTNLKNRFTVIHDGKECTVGDFMLMKAGKAEKAEKNSTALTVVNTNMVEKYISLVVKGQFRQKQMQSTDTK